MTVGSKYDRFLADGHWHRLRRGYQYSGCLYALRETLHKLAKRRGVRVETERAGSTLWVRAVNS